MELCGWQLPTVLGTFALFLFFVLAAGRPRSTGRWWAPVARVAMLVGLNALVLATAGALLNNQYAFYSDWSDLGGDSSASVQPQHFGGTTQQAQASVAGHGLLVRQPDSLPALAQPGHRVQRYTVKGARSGFTNEVLVRLPQHYDPLNPRKYPVILALHGFPGHPKAFRKLGGFYHDLDAAARNHTMAETVVVMPLINHPSSLDTECVDAPGGPQAETWLAHDVPSWVMTHFDVRTDRQSWATYGYSFGGWCAAMLGMRHPDVFGGAVVFQGYFRPEFDAPFRPFSVGSARYAQYDLVARARRNPPPLAMWVLATKPDKISYPSTAQFIAAARAPLSVTAELPSWGGHRPAVWEGRIPATFAWLGASLKGFRA